MTSTQTTYTFESYGSYFKWSQFSVADLLNFADQDEIMLVGVNQVTTSFYGNLGLLGQIGPPGPAGSPPAGGGGGRSSTGAPSNPPQQQQPLQPQQQRPQQQQPQQPTQQQVRCSRAARVTQALGATAAMNWGAGIITSELPPVGAIFGSIAAVESIGSGVMAVYTAYVCFQ